MIEFDAPLAVASVSFVGCLYMLYRHWNTRGLPLPPGPRPLPLLGNVLDVPRSNSAYLLFTEWKKKYGDMIYFSAFGNGVLVINKHSIAKDLMDKKSSMYSFRPKLHMANDVIGWKFSMTSMDYNETYKRLRRYMQTYFAKPRMPVFHPTQIQEARRLLKDISNEPDNYKAHVHRMAAGITMLLTYGHDVENLQDRFMRIAERGIATIAEGGIIGAHIVDLIPWLKYLPATWFIGPTTQQDLKNFVQVPFKQVSEQMANGTALNCYATNLTEQTKGQDVDGVRGTAALVYSGGLDTTMSGLMSAFTQMVVHPEIQAKVQEEMDRVVGPDRFPSFEDQKHLPYLYNVVSEVVRYASSTPVGVPHRVDEDDVYNGYLIPKGTTILANQWAMLHDPEVYKNPEEFNPDRFDSSGGKTPEPDPRAIAYGFGRRICPGRDLAEGTIWAFLASVFYAYKVTPALGDDGKPIKVDLSYNEGTVRHPKPFKAHFEPRRPNVPELIRYAEESRKESRTRA